MYAAKDGSPYLFYSKPKAAYKDLSTLTIAIGQWFANINWLTTELNSLEVTLSLCVPHMYNIFGFWCTTLHPTVLATILCSWIKQHPLINDFSIVTALSWWLLMQTNKKLCCQKWRPHKARRQFSKPSHAKEERNGPPSANQGLSTAKPRSSYAVCTLWVHPPTPSSPALSAGAEPKSQGHFQKWLHELKICQLQLKWLVVKG